MLCIKSAAGQVDHEFNIEQKVKNVVQFALNESTLGLNRDAKRSYKAWLEGAPVNRELVLEQSLGEQGVVEGSCILVAPSDNPDG